VDKARAFCTTPKAGRATSPYQLWYELDKSHFPLLQEREIQIEDLNVLKKIG
jgi:hypothetical protein